MQSPPRHTDFFAGSKSCLLTSLVADAERAPGTKAERDQGTQRDVGCCEFLLISGACLLMTRNGEAWGVRTSDRLGRGRLEFGVDFKNPW